MNYYKKALLTALVCLNSGIVFIQAQVSLPSDSKIEVAKQAIIAEEATAKKVLLSAKLASIAGISGLAYYLFRNKADDAQDLNLNEAQRAYLAANWPYIRHFIEFRRSLLQEALEKERELWWYQRIIPTTTQIKDYAISTMRMGLIWGTINVARNASVYGAKKAFPALSKMEDYLFEHRDLAWFMEKRTLLSPLCSELTLYLKNLSKKGYDQENSVMAQSVRDQLENMASCVIEQLEKMSAFVSYIADYRIGGDMMLIKHNIKLRAQSIKQIAADLACCINNQLTGEKIIIADLSNEVKGIFTQLTAQIDLCQQLETRLAL
jgi:hypothetical protein